MVDPVIATRSATSNKFQHFSSKNLEAHAYVEAKSAGICAARREGTEG